MVAHSYGFGLPFDLDTVDGELFAAHAQGLLCPKWWQTERNALGSAPRGHNTSQQPEELRQEQDRDYHDLRAPSSRQSRTSGGEISPEAAVGLRDPLGVATLSSALISFAGAGQISTACPTFAER